MSTVELIAGSIAFLVLMEALRFWHEARCTSKKSQSLPDLPEYLP